MGSPENRVYQRATLKVSVNMESENNFYAGITDNVSEGGVFIATVTPPPHGALVELSLELPGYPEPFAVKGVVVWVRDQSAAIEGAPAGVGVQWLEMSRAALSAITRFVQYRDTILYDE